MNLTANQCLNLLWIFHMEDRDLGLTSKEVKQLEVDVLSRFSQIDSPYRSRLVTQDVTELTEYLLKNGSGTTIFTEE